MSDFENLPLCKEVYERECSDDVQVLIDGVTAKGFGHLEDVLRKMLFVMFKSGWVAGRMNMTLKDI